MAWATGLVAAALALAPAAAAAPPTISGADDDAWNHAPQYVVTGGAGGVSWTWASTTGDAGFTLRQPFTVTLDRNLREGTHRLTVTQLNLRSGGDPGLAPSETAVRTFVIDTKDPKEPSLSAPQITEGEDLVVAFDRLEAGATVAWSVHGRRDDDGRVAAGETSGGPARVPGLPAGRYEVRATQRDRAGNVSKEATLKAEIAPAATTAPAPLSPTAPATPAPVAATPASPAPAVTPAVATARVIVRLPTMYPARLRPRRGVAVRTRRPMLRWRHGPRGTRLYNVQIFRVRTRAGADAGRTVTLRKVRSAFPRRTRLRTPRLARGACFVWRVWPYRGARFTSKPLGVSHFCVSRRAPRR